MVQILSYPCVWGARRGAAVSRRTARSVRDVHVVTKQLGYKLDVRRFAAASAGPGEFEIRFGKLGSLDGFIADGIFLDGNGIDGIIPQRSLRQLGFKRLHDESFFLGWATLTQLPAPVQSSGETCMRYS